MREVGVLSSHLRPLTEPDALTLSYNYLPECCSQNRGDQFLVDYPGRPHASTNVEPDTEGRAAHDCYHGVTIHGQVAVTCRL